MKSEYRSELEIRFVSAGKGGTYLWELISPLVYYSEILEREVIVPAGFRTNLASVAYKTHPKPPVTHDFLWSDPDILRSLGNAVYMEAMNVTKDINKFRRYARYWAVQVSQFFWKQGEP